MRDDPLGFKPTKTLILHILSTFPINLSSSPTYYPASSKTALLSPQLYITHQPTNQPAMADMFASRKRGRQEEEDDLQQCAPDSKVSVVKNLHQDCAANPAQQRSTLPFRTSPNTRHIRPFSKTRSRPSPLFTQTVTPADSSEEENSPPFQPTNQAYQQHYPTFGTSSNLQGDQNFDSDMDMTDSLPLISPRQLAQMPRTPSPQASPCTMEFQQPDCKQNQNSFTAGRLPTPIYGHFQRSIDAKMDMGGNLETHISRLQQETDYENYVRRRRLPTPIDEDEAMENSSAMSGDMMHLHLSGHSRRGGVDYTYHPSQILGSSENNFTFPSITDTLSSSAESAGPPPRKLSFSMGPRANCELCIRRVPGHSNHIIRT